MLVRPLLDVPKARLIATLAAIGISFADDPSNRDPRFTRPRLRALMPVLADEGLDARRFALLARRLRRADATIEVAVDAAAVAISEGPWSDRGPIKLDVDKFAALPAEVALRLMGRAIARVGDEGPVELGKLETLHAQIDNALRRGGGQGGPPAPHIGRRARHAFGGSAPDRACAAAGEPNSAWSQDLNHRPSWHGRCFETAIECDKNGHFPRPVPLAEGPLTPRL